MRKIIFDIETKNTFQDVNSNNPADLDISVVCLYDSETNSYHSFLEDQFDAMWDHFREATLLVTFNGNHFDIPCLQKHCPFDLKQIEHIDIFEKVREVTGKKLGLGGIAETTLGIAKSGHGLDAIAWWNSGKIQKIIDYCIQDVKVTKSVYDYAREHGQLRYTDKLTKEITIIHLNAKDWEKQEVPLQPSLF